MVNAANEIGRDGEILPPPVNWFKQVLIKQRGELEVKDSLAERNDALVLKALVDGVVVLANAYPEKKVGIGSAPVGAQKGGKLLVRVYRPA
jgi:uncharacterized protein YcgI (DUF1989 family)